MALREPLLVAVDRSDFARGLLAERGGSSPPHAAQSHERNRSQLVALGSPDSVSAGAECGRLQEIQDAALA